MSAPYLAIGFLAAGCFTLATSVGPGLEQKVHHRPADFLASMLGESRKVLAEQVYVRSDVYFHGGYYPSVFERAAKAKKQDAQLAFAQEGQHQHDEHCQHDHEHSGHAEHGQCEHDHGESKPTSSCGHDCQHDHDHGHGTFSGIGEWLDSFTKHFYVSKHSHLTEKGIDAPKEMLPWLRLSARMNPQLVQSYTVGAFWLRTLDRHNEAERFLREGLRHNPGSFEIMMELGRGYFERRDYDRARNVLEAGMARWRESENPKAPEERDNITVLQILNLLARLEARTGNTARAVEWLTVLKKVSPHPDLLDQRIAELRAGKTLEAE